MTLELADAPLRDITNEEIDAYLRDGVVCLRGVFPGPWIDFMRDAVEIAMAKPGPHAEEYEKDGGGRFFGDLDIARRHQAFGEFVMNSPAAEIAGRIMEAHRVNFFYDQLLVKEPGTGTATPWHQDQPYWAVSGRQVASIWLPFDPVEKSAAVEYVRGSHEWPEYSPYHFSDGSAYADTGLPMLPDIDADRSAYDIVSFAMEPGDCLVFQAMIVHGAPANRTGNRRRALATRWTGDDARFHLRQGEVAIPTRDPGLAHGDRMDCADFPCVWERAA